MLSEMGILRQLTAPLLDSEAQQHLVSFNSKGDQGEYDGQSHATYKALSHCAVGE